MPYIKPMDRSILLQQRLADLECHTVAELTYCLYLLCVRFVPTGPDAGWTEKADVIKALECAKLEFYRRKIGPHEDGAIERNGDVF